MTDEKIKEIKQEIEDLENATLENNYFVKKYNDYLDNLYGPITIGYLEYDTSKVLFAVDEIAYNMGFDDFINSTIEDLQQELEELENNK